MHDALRRVLQSRTFRSSRRSRELLAYVVTESIGGRGDDLSERALLRLALGRGDDADPRTDPAARVQAGRVRDALARYYADEGRADPVQIVIPTGQYAAVFVETTPSVASAAPGEPASGTRGPGLAVVRFHPAGSTTADRRAAIGLSETLVRALSRFPGLRIFGPLVAVGAGSASELADVAERTGAGFVVHGTVRTSDDVVRVNARLVDGASGRVMWSESFDRVDDLAGFGAEDDIVARIAGVLADYRGVVLRGPLPAVHPSDDPVVYQAIVSYYEFLDRLDPALGTAAAIALEDAATREPDNDLVLATLAATYAVDVLMRGAAAVESMERAEQLARSALATDPRHPQAHGVLGIVALARGRTAEARRHADLMMDVAPYHPSTMYLAGMLVEACGDWDAGIDIIRRAVELNPYHPSHQRTLLAIDHLMRADTAAALAEASLLDFPGYPYGALLRAICLADLGLVDDARRELAELARIAPDLMDRPQEVLAVAPTLPDHVVELLSRHVEALRRYVTTQ
jgi:adenylate cyclase